VAGKEDRLRVQKTYKRFIDEMVHARTDQSLASVPPILDKGIELT
jgi:hypothetical protein